MNALLDRKKMLEVDVPKGSPWAMNLIPKKLSLNIQCWAFAAKQLGCIFIAVCVGVFCFQGNSNAQQNSSPMKMTVVETKPEKPIGYYNWSITIDLSAANDDQSSGSIDSQSAITINLLAAKIDLVDLSTAITIHLQCLWQLNALN